MKNNSKLKVAIVIPTMNRTDYVIRQLEYYARIKSPHPVYIGDASNKENSKKMEGAIKRLSKELTIYYYTYPETMRVTESHIDLDNKVQEKYCVFSGDDDYQIPDSITKCAEFLETHPDYSSVSGYSISFRLIGNGVYGQLNRLADYTRGQIESETSAKRLIDFMAQYYVPLFSVHRTKDMIRSWSKSLTIKDSSFANEIMHSAMSSVLGKSKIIDCLSLVRQLDSISTNPGTKTIGRTLNTLFEWITNKDWQPSYEIFCEALAEEISRIDKINIDEARKAPKEALWGYLNINLPAEYNKLKPRKLGMGEKLLKKISRKIGSFSKISTKVKYINSPYYKDFKPVIDSFMGKYHN